MNYATIKAITDKSRRGTIHTVVTNRQLKTLKNVTDVITKETTAQIRIGVNYNNIKKIKEAKANGLLQGKNNNENNIEYLDDRGVFKKYKSTGTIVLNAAKAHGNKSVVVYKKNGVIVEKAEVEPLCQAKEFPKPKEGGAPSEVYSININDIVSFK